MKKYLGLILILAIALHSCKSDKKTETEDATVETDSIAEETPSVPEVTSSIEIHPINHATMVLEHDQTVIYVDPVGGAEAFEGMPKPKIALVTDIHGDHFDVNTLTAINTSDLTIVVPKAVAEKIPDALGLNLAVISNGQDINLKNSTTDVNIEAIPMYNLREEALKFHDKGRGNGYVLTLGGQRIYISGDTEDIPEMRNLKDIDIAFVCMNLPYTMTVDSAASAVLDFKPKKVYPYHYRGTEGLSDVGKFKTLVNEEDSTIEVVQLDWYPKS